MKKTLAVLLLFYLVALHTSMAGMEIFSAAIVLCVLIYQIQHRDFKIFHANRSLALWMAGMVLAVLISLLATPQEKTFIYQFGFMRWTILFWSFVFALTAVWNADFEKRLLKVWILALTVAGACGVVQCLTGVDFVHHESEVAFQGGGIYRAVGFFSVSLTYAYVMGMSMFALALPGRQQKSLGLVAVILGALGMISSTSRGAWVAATVAVLFYLWCTRKQLVIPAIGAISLLAMGLTYLGSGFGSKIMLMVTMQVDHSSSMRFDLWKGYWAMFLDHPIFGIGLLEGDKLLPAYYAKLGINQDFVSHAHNNFLQWLAGTGIVGFTCYMAVIWIFLAKAWRLREKNPAWGWSLFTAQLFFHIGGLTEANFIAAITNHFLIFIWALVLVIEAQPQGVVDSQRS